MILSEEETAWFPQGHKLLIVTNFQLLGTHSCVQTAANGVHVEHFKIGVTLKQKRTSKCII